MRCATCFLRCMFCPKHKRIIATMPIVCQGKHPGIISKMLFSLCVCLYNNTHGATYILFYLFSTTAYCALCDTYCLRLKLALDHYEDVIMSTMASQITSLKIVYSTVYSGADQRKHQSSASLALVRVPGEFPAQMASNAENVSIWWRHHDTGDS